METTAEFDEDLAAIQVGAPRIDAHIRVWWLWLERRPFVFTHGLTSPDDESRVLVTNEGMLGLQYVVGVTIDRERRVVTLRWLDTADGTD